MLLGMTTNAPRAARIKLERAPGYKKTPVPIPEGPPSKSEGGAPAKAKKKQRRRLWRLGDEFWGDGERAAEAESARSNFQSGGGLLALVLVAVDLKGNVADQVEREAEVRGDLFGRAHFLDVSFEDAVEHV